MSQPPTEPSISVELVGHVCDPNAKCTQRGRNLRLVVRENDITLLIATFTKVTRISHKKLVSHVERDIELNNLTDENNARISQKISERFDAYRKSNQICSGWARVGITTFVVRRAPVPNIVSSYETILPVLPVMLPIILYIMGVLFDALTSIIVKH